MGRSQRVVIIPALNEQATIADVVAKARPFADVLVVDDGSRDQTSFQAAQAGAIVVRHESNRGYEQALNSGFREAIRLGYAYGLTFDADGQHDAGWIEKFFAPLETGPTMVVAGSRAKLPRFSEIVMAIYFRLVWKIRDPLCGMKSYNLNLVREKGEFEKFGCMGTETIVFAARKGGSILQIPVPIHERKDRPRVGTLFRANIRIFRSFLRLLRHQGELQSSEGGSF